MATFDRAIDGLAPTCREEEERNAFDVLPILSRKIYVLSVLFKRIALSLGAQVLENLQSNVMVPSTTGSASGGWLTDETTGQAPSDPTLSGALLSPKNRAVLTSYSRQLKLTAPQSEAVIKTHLLRETGAGIDAAVLNGQGTGGEPTGLLVVGGTQTQSGTTLGQAGVTNMLEQAVTNGANDANVAFIAAPTVREILQNRERAAGSGYVWDNNQVAGKPAHANAGMPSGAMIVGDFSQVVIGFFGSGIELAVDPYTAFKTGVVTIRAIVSVDVGILFPGSFCKAESIT